MMSSFPSERHQQEQLTRELCTLLKRRLRWLEALLLTFCGLTSENQTLPQVSRRSRCSRSRSCRCAHRPDRHTPPLAPLALSSCLLLLLLREHGLRRPDRRRWRGHGWRGGEPRQRRNRPWLLPTAAPALFEQPAASLYWERCLARWALCSANTSPSQHQKRLKSKQLGHGCAMRDSVLQVKCSLDPISTISPRTVTGSRNRKTASALEVTEKTMRHSNRSSRLPRDSGPGCSAQLQ